MFGIAVKEQYYTNVNRKKHEFIEHKVIVNRDLKTVKIVAIWYYRRWFLKNSL